MPILKRVCCCVICAAVHARRWGKNGAQISWKDPCLQLLQSQTLARKRQRERQRLRKFATTEESEGPNDGDTPYILLPTLLSTCSAKYVVQQKRFSAVSEEKTDSAREDEAGWSTVRTVPSLWKTKDKAERRRRGITTVVKTLVAGEKYLFRVLKMDCVGRCSEASSVVAVQTKRVAPPTPQLVGFRRQKNELTTTYKVKLRLRLGRSIAPQEWLAHHGSAQLQTGSMPQSGNLRLCVYQSRAHEHWLQMKPRFAPTVTSTTIAMTSGLGVPRTDVGLQVPAHPQEWEKIQEISYEPQKMSGKHSEVTLQQLPSAWTIAVAAKYLNSKRYFSSKVVWDGVESQMSDPLVSLVSRIRVT